MPDYSMSPVLYNLTQNTDGGLPVRYFTELLAQALGVEEA